MSTLDKNKELVLNYIVKLGTADTSALEQLISQDFIYHNPNCGIAGGTLAFAQLEEGLKNLKQACPGGIRFEILDMTAEADRVSCRADGYSQFHDGRDYNNRYHFFFKIRDGKIFEGFEYMDSLLVEKFFS